MGAFDEALATVDDWPVDHVAAVVVAPGGPVAGHGPLDRRFALASVSKPLTAYGVLVAVEEATIGLDDAVGQPGCTVRHLLAHAGGYPLDGDAPLVAPGTRRIYSNAAFDLLGAHVATASGLAFDTYLSEAVLAPLRMTATGVGGSPARDYTASATDIARFAVELLTPTLLAAGTLEQATSEQFPGLAGVVPGYGRFDPCPWGLGVELKGTKAPHWTAPAGSARTFGHFGAAGTFVWVDPTAQLGLVVLTDRPFGPWAHERWPLLGSAVLAARLEERDR